MSNSQLSNSFQLCTAFLSLDGLADHVEVVYHSQNGHSVRGFDLAVPFSEVGRIIASLNKGTMVYFDGHEAEIEKIDYDTLDVVITQNETEHVTNLGQCRLFPPTQDFLHFLTGAVLVDVQSQHPILASDHVSDSINELNECDHLLVPCDECCAIIHYEPSSGLFFVPNLNNPYETASLAFALLSGYWWLKTEA